ncbi:hypothetical protein Ancab_040363 [Ancistrocladus abbreviatus]
MTTTSRTSVGTAKNKNSQHIPSKPEQKAKKLTTNHKFPQQPSSKATETKKKQQQNSSRNQNRNAPEAPSSPPAKISTKTIAYLAADPPASCKFLTFNAAGQRSQTKREQKSQLSLNLIHSKDRT